MNTREQAALLRRYADFLDSIGEFKIDAMFVASNNGTVSQHFYDKAEFTAAAKAVGNATKKFGEGEYADFELIPKGFPWVSLKIARNAVCKKVVRFECEPLFSGEELESL